MQELLEETQSQSEELQAQHSELEAINTELEMQTQKLQASEEELRVQQEELTQANAELLERTKAIEEKNELILQRNTEIQAKAEELALSTKYKSEFLANMSHELRTPLNSIFAFLSRLLSENSENNLSNDQVEYAKVIQSSGKGLLLLIDEILDLSKIESGKMDIEYTAVSLQGIADDIYNLFAPLAREKNIELKINLSAHLPPRINTDRLKLEQIIRNLLSNALKFTSEGTVSLDISPSVNNGFITIKVKDTGIGIPKEKQKIIFEAFQQADGSTKRKYGGTGLGLSISRQLAKLLHTEISLQSEPGKGSEFTLELPINANGDGLFIQQEKLFPAKEDNTVKDVFTLQNIPESIPDDRKNIQSSDKIILIIEDDVNFAKSLADFAKSKSYKVIIAVRGDEGIELAQKFRPTGILLDIQLPVKNGWMVMDELKAIQLQSTFPCTLCLLMK